MLSFSGHLETERDQTMPAHTNVLQKHHEVVPFFRLSPRLVMSKIRRCNPRHSGALQAVKLDTNLPLKAASDTPVRRVSSLLLKKTSFVILTFMLVFSLLEPLATIATSIDKHARQLHLGRSPSNPMKPSSKIPTFVLLSATIPSKQHLQMNGRSFCECKA